MTPAELSRTVLATVRRAVEAGELSVPVPARVKVEQPRHPGSGHYATGIALQLAGPAGRPPRSVAEILSARLAAEPGIAGVEIAGPGFLNISLDASAHTGLVAEILHRGAEYGHGDDLHGTAVELRFPHETRAAVTADALARILEARGADVVLSGPVPADPAWSALGVRLPDNGGATRGGEPNRETVHVRPVPVRSGSPGTGSPDTRPVPTDGDSPRPDAPEAGAAHHPGPAAVLLDRFGADATRWALLRPAAHDHPRLTDDLLVQRESNPLFRVRYAHARARALVRNAADLGFAPDPAAGRHAQAESARAVRDQAEGTATLRAQAGSTHHPITRNITAEAGAPHDAPAAAALLGALAGYPAVVRSAARLRAPDRVARHLVVLADDFFRFHDTCAVLPRGGEKPEAAHRVRVAFAQAAGTVLAGGLHLLGITAPEML